LSPCFDGESLILTKDILTGVIENIPVKKIVSDNYQVFSPTKEKFVPLIMNIKTGPVNKFKIIPKNLIDIDVPFKDILITGRHKVVINGQEIKVADIKGTKNLILEKSQPVYTLCTQDREPILTNGMNVMSWNLEGWNNYCSTYGIEWENILKKL
jgi:hypothetical protein